MNIQDLIPKVVANIKTTGKVRPTVYTQLNAGSIQPYPLLQFMGDSRMKAHLLFAEGRQAGQQHLERDLVETVFITEIWLTQGQRNPNPGERPPTNIPQKEGVMFAIAENNAPFQTLVKAYEIKRGKKGKAEELIYLSESLDPEGLMGVAFIAGWRSRSLSDAEVKALQQRGMRSFLGPV